MYHGFGLAWFLTTIIYFCKLANHSHKPSRISQMVAYDQDLAEAFGIEDRATFSTFYNILHGLAIAGSCDANNVNQDNAAQYDQYNNQDGNYNQDGYYDQDGNYNQDGDQDAEAEDNEEDNGEDQDAEDEDNEGEQEGQEDGDEGRRLAVLRRRLDLSA